MPKKKGKGEKNRKRGKNEADDEKRELVFKEDGQDPLGDGCPGRVKRRNLKAASKKASGGDSEVDED
ncbi:hypothetical protein QJS10_CPB11g01352 [Acorus calamus]|uniref:Uncharacterized protein n=1 Tax=Acorus calamus TaxID=4465 RepID=A0AAV9DTB9_ACOCL|nr:hypothetical protein QJS10_CPB11g01352 [Acorus calamus]